MKDLDLSGVDPLRWSEIRRRVATITDFLALEKPTPLQRDEHARRLGIGTKSFMRLVAIWEAHRQASLLDGAGAIANHRLRKNRMPGATRQAVIDAATQLGPEARLAEIVARATVLCKERDTPMVGRSAAWNVLMEARLSGVLGHAGKPEIIVGSLSARLPVLAGNCIALPRLDLAVLAPEGAIITYQLSVEPDQAPDRDLVMQWVRTCATAGADPRPVCFADGESGNGCRIDPATRKRLTAVLGRGLDDLDLLYQPRAASAGAALPPSKVNVPLTPLDAAEAVRQAVLRHNARRCPDGFPRYDLQGRVEERP